MNIIVDNKYLNSYSYGTGSTYISRQYAHSLVEAGEVKFDFTTQCLRIFNGSQWVPSPVGENHAISLTRSTIDILEWAREKMHEEYLAQKYPAVAEAKSHYETLLALVSASETKQP
jgi:hypothetical protein